MSNLYAMAIPVLLVGVHLLGLHKHSGVERYKKALRSYTAGVSVAYVFLFLLPELPLLAGMSGVNTWVLALFGFAMFHGAHKFVFANRKWDWGTKYFLDEIHLLTAAAYSFLLTFSLVELAMRDVASSLLLTLVIALHLGLTELSHRELSGELTDAIKIPVLVGATILGGILPLWPILPQAVVAVIFGLTAGAIIYTAIREELPSDKDSLPVIFLLGVSTLTAMAMAIH